MKSFNKRISHSSLKPFTFNPSIAIVALVLLFTITGFVAVNERAPNDFFMPGVVFEVETKDHEQSPPKTAEMEVAVEGKNIKIDILPDQDKNGKGKMIFRGDKGANGEFVMVDDDKKEYYVMDEAFVNSMLGSIDKSQSMMEEAMKNLTKEQQEMIAQAQKKSGNKMPGMSMMGLPSKPELKKTGERGTKSGYPCVKYEVYLDGKKIKEIWTTDWSNIDGGGEAQDAFAGMNKFFEKIKDKIGDMLGDGGPYDDMNFENGFPVVTKNFNEDDGSLEDESWLIKTRRQRIDIDAFEPPSGYKRRTMGPTH